MRLDLLWQQYWSISGPVKVEWPKHTPSDTQNMAYERASATTNDHQELGEVGGASWERVACVINDCRVVRCCEDRKVAWDGQREGIEVCDRRVVDTMYSRVLQRNNGTKNRVKTALLARIHVLTCQDWQQI